MYASRIDYLEKVQRVTSMHTWNGFISFGLVHIPVGLLPAAKEETIEFNQLHREDGGRINLKKVCAACGRELAAEDIVKGYAYEKGKYVRFEPDEIERMKAPGEKTIRIERFVRMSEIEPRYYEKAYYVEPNGGSQAFHLLRKAMETEGRAGLAKVVMGMRDYLAALTAEGNAMMLYRLYFASEMRPAPEIPDAACGDREQMLARIMIGNLAAPFRPEEYRDGFQAKLRRAIKHKIAGEEIPAEPEGAAPDAPANLMDALEASILAE
jgi:DNA end-binding protein Ku